VVYYNYVLLVKPNALKMFKTFSNSTNCEDHSTLAIVAELMGGAVYRDSNSGAAEVPFGWDFGSSYPPAVNLISVVQGRAL
jgi:hypothetical protein